MLSDLPLEQLETYRPDLPEPADFDRFWAGQLETARSHPLDVDSASVATQLRTVEVFDVRFRGYAGTPVAGWLLLPAHRDGPLPAIVEFASYGGGRGLPHDRLVWSAAGYAHLIMDSRAQGSSSTKGVTRDPQDPGDPAAPGYLTRGILHPDTAYLTRLYVDAARAVEVARGHDAVDPERVAVAGVSQGGGLALAAANLGGPVRAVIAAVPFLAHIRRALDLTDEDPYAEIASYCTAHPDHLPQVFATLAYHDVVHHARRLTSPTLLATGLGDVICPPSTVYAAANHHGGEVTMLAYPFDGHDGGGSHRVREELAFAATHLR
ncbi:MAG: acetylxylan esterase [Nitriliruptoraceae bacterium]